VVRFATRPEREYMVWYTTNGLRTPTWMQGPTERIQGTGGIEEWIDPSVATNKRFYRIGVSLPD